MVKNGTIDRLAGVVMFDGVVPRFFWNQFGRGRLDVHSGLSDSSRTVANRYSA
jgi:hypothetical protein